MSQAAGKGPGGGLLRRLDRAGEVVENSLLTLLLVGMIAIASGQIVARNLFDTNWIMGDEVLRLMVLWLTLVGALAASRADQHINIAVLDRFLSGWLLGLARTMVQLFTATICGLLAWHSAAFVRTSHEFGDTLLGSVPAWLPQLILPLGFGLMAWRHLLLAAATATGRDVKPAHNPRP
jgi:TRAP-type C4-dicarboxylate transport system permease small subunit